MELLATLLFAALLYSAGERMTRDAFSLKRNGSLHFFRIGRLSGSFCVRKVR